MNSGLSEKLQQLNERDKQMRESRHRHTDINTATAVIGTCPDMCPEHERLFREETKQLSPFEETRDGKPDYHAMVKEYRRAGADQAEPLPHELRPGPVLLRTMDYLICNIMDRQEEPGMSGEWFDFLWNRTRAIRKDITQQHFCDATSVSLMEKCVRFHIHCAASLVEEDIAAFDPKINNENLTKCMQSLKDFYHDLWLKGIACPNEPEFRAYEVLLNLTDSDILRELKHLRIEIRDSPEVNFAVKAFFALSSNNYVRFFNLVRSTTYMNACLMHRYFDQVRMQGLRLIRKACTTAKSSELYPLQIFRDHFGFDSFEQARSFCEMFDIQVTDDNFVNLVRERGTEMTYGQISSKTRSKLMVESKRTRSIGEAINNSPLPDNPYRKFPLHNSFDIKGRLRKNAMNAQDQKEKCDLQRQEKAFLSVQPVHEYDEDSQEFPAEAESQEPPLVPAAPSKPRFSKQEIQVNVIDPFVENLVENLVKEQVPPIARKLTNRITLVNQASIELADKILAGGIGLGLKEWATDAIDQEIVFNAEQRLVKLNKIEKASELLGEKLIGTISDASTKALASQTYIEELSQYICTNADLMTKLLIDESVRLMTPEAAKEMYKLNCQEREILVRKMRSKRAWRLANNCFIHWKRLYLQRKRLRHLKRTFPAGTIETVEPKVRVINNSPTTPPSQPSVVAKVTEEPSTSNLNPSPKRLKSYKSLEALPLGNKHFMKKFEQLQTPIRAYLAGPSNALDNLTLLEMKLKEIRDENKNLGESFAAINGAFNELDYLESL